MWEDSLQLVRAVNRPNVDCVSIPSASSPNSGQAPSPPRENSQMPTKSSAIVWITSSNNTHWTESSTSSYQTARSLTRRSLMLTRGILKARHRDSHDLNMRGLFRLKRTSEDMCSYSNASERGFSTRDLDAGCLLRLLIGICVRERERESAERCRCSGNSVMEKCSISTWDCFKGVDIVRRMGEVSGR